MDYGLESVEKTRYRYDLSIEGKTILKDHDIGGKTVVDLPDEAKRRQMMNMIKPENNIEPQWEIAIQTFRESRGKWSKWVKVYLVFDDNEDSCRLLGIQRQE